MNAGLLLLLNLITSLAKLVRPGGYRALIAENLILKHQLIIHNRSRQRSPNLNTQDRIQLGFLTLFLTPRRIIRSAIIIRPSTLLRFHAALVKRKYQSLYSAHGGNKPGPKGPSRDVINAIVEIKHRNPRFGCPRIAQQINLAFGLDLNKDTVRLTINQSLVAAPLGLQLSAMRRIAYGVSIFFAPNPSHSKHTGSWWCRISTPAG